MAETAFTAAEAAFVLREPLRQIKKELDTGPVQAKLIRKAGEPFAPSSGRIWSTSMPSARFARN